MSTRKHTLALAVAGLLACGSAVAEHSRWGYPPVVETDHEATRLSTGSPERAGSAVAVEPRWGYPPVIETVHKAGPVLSAEPEEDAQVTLTYEPRWGYPPIVDTPHKPTRVGARASLDQAHAANRGE